MTSRILFVVRHGRTALNAAGQLRGRLDPPLDEQGQREAELLGVLFAGIPVGVVVSSPLVRARETARAIADATGAPARCDDAFVDRDYGSWVGHVRSELEATFGSVDRAPGVEPLDSMVRRAVLGARGVAEAADRSVVVAHDAINRALLAHLATNTPDDPEGIPQRTGCWNRLERRDDEWSATVVDALPGDGQHPS